jgi:hypothetical protein
MTIRRILTLVSSLVLMLVAHPALAQDADELAVKTQNPVGDLISVPFQANWDMGIGDRQATGTILNFQPVMPFNLMPNWNVIFRVIMPLSSQPDTSGVRFNGLGDTTASLFLTPENPGKTVWGVGPAFLLPTATNNALGTEKFGFGPTVVLLRQPRPWTLGILANHIWSVDGSLDRPGVSQTFLQPFVNYNVGAGLALGASSEISINWKDDGSTTAPLLFSVSKVTKLANRPVNLTMAAGPMLSNPSGADWRFRMAIVFLFPK